MNLVLLVALGAAVGAPARYLTDRFVQARTGAAFPWGTLAVNTAGSFLLGVLVALPAGTAALAGLGAGFCGAFTTYSTLGYETLRLARSRTWGHPVANVAANLVAGLAAVYAGMAVARSVLALV